MKLKVFRFKEYVHEDYIDLDEEGFISSTVQKWATDRYTPPVFNNGPMFLNAINEKIEDLNKKNDRILRIIKTIDWYCFEKKLQF